jgi:hypothetical protein
MEAQSSSNVSESEKGRSRATDSSLEKGKGAVR